jgi:hypothetical protein
VVDAFPLDIQAILGNLHQFPVQVQEVSHPDIVNQGHVSAFQGLVQEQVNSASEFNFPNKRGVGRRPF